MADPNDKGEASANFVLQKCIGEGIAGKVSIYQYTGDDTLIRAMTTTPNDKGGLLVVKEPKIISGHENEYNFHAETARNEMDIILHLNEYHNNENNEVLHYPKSAVIKIDGKNWQLGELIYYAKE